MERARVENTSGASSAPKGVSPSGASFDRAGLSLDGIEVPSLPPLASSSVQLTEVHASEFVRRLRLGDGAADDYVQDLLQRGATVESVYLDLLAPAARILGTLWEDDRCDFVEVTLVLGRIQRFVHSISPMFLPRKPAEEIVGRALLACVPNEQHSLGIFIVAEFLLRAGWAVSLTPPASGRSNLVDQVRSEWFDVVGFSVACDSHLALIKREIGDVRRHSRNRRIGILVGGRTFNDHPELVHRVGADASAGNAREAALVAAKLL